MNFPAQVVLDAARCTALAAAAFAIGWSLGGGKRTPLRWLCLLAPLLTPSLLISYAAAPIAQHFTGAALVAFYSALLALKLAPLAALVRDFFPSPLSAEAAHCAHLLPRSATERAWFAVRAAGPMPWAALSILFLIAFTDFELASLLAVKSWTVMLFDAHIGGLAVGESLRRVAWPAGIELVVLLALILPRWNATSGRVSLAAARTPERAQRSLSTIALALLISGLPLARIAWLAAPGIGSLSTQTIFAADLLVSLGFAAGASLGAWLAVRRLPSWCALPGLLGALVLALLFLAVIQLPPLRWLRDTPIPLLAVEALLLAPIALLLRILLRSQEPREALHLARMAGSRRLLWDLALLPRAAALALLFTLAYFELTAASILAPLGMTPVFARLHNLAHYGQTAVLSAMLLAAVFAPALLLALTLGAARLYARRDVR